MTNHPVNPLDAGAADLLAKVIGRLDDLTEKHGVEFTGRVRLLTVLTPNPAIDSDPSEPEVIETVPTVMIEYRGGIGGHVALPAVEVVTDGG